MTRTTRDEGIVSPAPVGPVGPVGPVEDRRRAIVIEPRTIWLAASVAAGLAAGWVVVSKALDVLALLFIALVFAEGIRPLVDWLGRRRVPRTLAVLLIYVVILAAVAALGVLLARPLVAQAAALVDNLPRYQSRLQDLLAQAQRAVSGNPQAERILRALPVQAGGVAQWLAPLLLRGPLALISLLFNAVLVLLLAFFWLTTAGGLKGFVVRLFPRGAQDTASDVIAEMGRKVGGYLRGVAINMVVIGLLSGGGVLLLGLPYPFLLAVLAGLTEAIPIIGPFVGGAPAVLVALATAGPLKAGEVALLYLLIQQIEGNTLVPLVMNRVVQLNPLTVTVAILLGSALLGVVGSLLAVPAAAIMQVLVARVLAPAARRAPARIDARATAGRGPAA